MDAEVFMRAHMQHLIRQNPLKELISMPYHQNADIKANYEALPPEIKTLFHQIFNRNKRKIIFKEVLPFKAKKSSAPICHRLLSAKVQSYRCFDCQIHPQTLLCEECFKKGNHEGHRYIQVNDVGDCDCGNKNIIKEIGFCPDHCGEQEIIEIDRNEGFVFNIYFRQIFIWILKLIKIQAQDGELLLQHLLIYLAELNDLSSYYNKLTTRLIFAENNSIVDHLFYISLNAKEKGKLVVTTISLFMKMMVLKEFKERLLSSLIVNYNKIDNFQTSKYVKLLFPVLTQTDVVISAMNNFPVACRPERSFNVTAYYDTLTIILNASPAAAEAILAPLLQVDAIVFPFLSHVEERCEKMNNLIVTVFPQFQKEEQIYYGLLANIISVVSKKEILADMIVNYWKMTLNFSFKKNKIILVPQRILFLIIYKYFDYDLSKIDAQHIKNILELETSQFDDQIKRNWLKFAECLFQFSINLNRTNYFQNYLAIYVKEKSQVICIDYLAFRIMAAISKHKDYIFQSVLDQIFRTDNEKMNRQADEKADIVKAGNIFLKVLVEIIYSPRTEIIVSALLGRQSPDLPSIMQKLFQTTGQITRQELDCIGWIFNRGDLPRTLLDDNLTFDSNKKKYFPKTNTAEKLSLELFVSLLQTNFSKFIQAKKESDEFLHLSQLQLNQRQMLLRPRTLDFLVRRQLRLMEGNPQEKKLIRDLARTIKTIKIIYLDQEEQFQLICETILSQIKKRYQPSQSHDCPNRIFIIQVQQQLIHNSSQPIQNEEFCDKQALRRKELLRLKKQKLMKNKKIKENQQKFLEPHKDIEQEQSEQMCLICKEHKDMDQICYVGKVRMSSLLYNFLKIQGDNAIFKSCYHTVHFDCFTRLQKKRQAACCPLCKCAINILLPIENTYKYSLLEKINNRIQHVLSYLLVSQQSKEKRGFVLEALLYYTYLLAVNIEDLSKIDQKQLRLCKILYMLIDHNLSFEERQAKAEAVFNLIVSKYQKQRDNLKLSVYSDLMNFVQTITFWNAANSNDLDAPLLCLNILSESFKMSTIKKMLKIMNDIISSPDTSALEPVLIACDQQITPKISQDIEENSFNTFWKPPSDVLGLLKLRDSTANHCTIGHQICICLICSQSCCFTCKKVSQHVSQHHSRQCLLFNTHNGGLFYSFHGMEISIKSLYINNIGNTWKPEFKVDGFYVDQKLSQDLLTELKAGSLFNFVITTLQGLKGTNISDRI